MGNDKKSRIRPTHFGRKLAEERKILNLGRDDFAAIVEPESANPDKLVQQYEYGIRNPRHQKAAQYARALGKDPWYFNQAIERDKQENVSTTETTSAIIGVRDVFQDDPPEGVSEHTWKSYLDRKIREANGD